KDPNSEYKNDIFTIYLNKLSVGTYVSSVDAFLLEQAYGITSATYKHHNVNWSYSTQNVDININDFGLQTGSLTIDSINTKAQYFEGAFEYDLFAPLSVNPNNTIAPVRIRNGYFQYIKYN